MAKPAPAPAAAAPAVAAAASPFTVTFGSAPAPTTRKVGIESSPYSGVMKSMPAPAGGSVAQFFIPAEATAGLTDAGEKQKSAAENARKITNRISGIARRLKKSDASMNFAMRTVTENGQLGVRVYRVEAAPAAPAPTAA